MNIVTLLDAKLTNGADLLLDGADLAIESGEKVCLVGRNGVGKSSLLSVIDGSRDLDAGRLIMQSGLRISKLMQDPPHYREGTAYSLTAGGVPVVGQSLAEFSLCQDPKRQSELAAFIENHDGWTKDAVVRKILNKIGLDPDIKLENLSGGWRRKAALAAALAGEPDLLLLDEPTNHLDIETILWFEQEILNFKGSIVFVTHDKAFADDCATRIVELDRGKLYSYPGKFSRYLELRDERLRMETLANKEFDRLLAEDEAWIRRGVKARLARNEGRVKDLLERREIRKNRRDRAGNVIMKANEAERTGNLVFELRDIHEEFDGKVIIDNFNATVIRGDRIGIVGPNGAGKTTLIKIIMGSLKPSKGYVRTGMNVQTLYFDQYHEQLNPDKTVADNVADGHTEVVINGKAKHVVSYLSNFLFTGRRARSPAGILSGGEKNRLLLARLFAKPSNVLIMDEPTNDLDLETLDLLEDLIASYKGTVIVISHDRDFIDKTATETWVLDGHGGVESIVGGWSDVQAYYDRIGRCQSAQRREIKAETKLSAKAESKDAKKQGLSFTEAHELEALPEKVELLEQKLESLDKELQLPEIYQDGGLKAKELALEREQLNAEIERLYGRWEELESKSK